MKKRYLVLADGSIFPGEAFGADVSAIGEAVFTTGMCGYLETLTDPSYYGQIVLQTFPLIGNYGVIPEDFEGKCHVRGYVVREVCDTPSNFRSRGTLDAFLRENGVPGIFGVDTREITRKLRECGVMNAYLTDEDPTGKPVPPEVLSYTVHDAVKSVSADAVREYPAVGTEKYHVVLMDFGAKKNIVRELCRRGCRVTAVPGNTSSGAVLALAPDGVMLSNGPGDPAENTEIILEIAGLIGRVPVFGICLGHQLFALALGGKTVKLKYGHRGVNQPVRCLSDGRTYITSQNHGYAVLPHTVPVGEESFVNANDGTSEGMDYPDLCAFTVQFHPEAAAGPHDTGFLFDRFISMMGGNTDAD